MATLLLIFQILLLRSLVLGNCPCLNGGTCVGGNRCLCTSQFYGTRCQTDAYYLPNADGSCAYHIQHLNVATKQQAYDICRRSGAHLAMPSTPAKQMEIESIYEQFISTDSPVVNLYLGTSGTSAYFDDETPVRLFPDETGFPPWGHFNPNIEVYPGSTTLVLSNEADLVPSSDDHVLHWKEINPNELKGYVCERHVSNQCAENSCNYPAQCENVGCSYKCTCQAYLSSISNIDCSFMHPTCLNTVCVNRGSCIQAERDVTCSCVPGVFGPKCEQELFVFDEMAGDECEYLVRFLAHHTSLEGAKRHCEAKNSVLVVIRNKIQQNIVENVIRRFYDDIHLRIWISGERNQDNFLFPDGSYVNLTPTEGYPRWGNNEPSSLNRKNGLMLSTTARFNPQTSSGAEYELYWKDANSNELAGFVCEKRSSILPSVCESEPCMNQGNCREYGCGFLCVCTEEYTGVTCEDCSFPSPCDENACYGNGKCTRLKCSTTDFMCECNIGWKGEYCDICELACDASVCHNSGTCVNSLNCTEGLRCNCPEIYTGQRCENCIYDPCQNVTCQNGGTCRVMNGCSDQSFCECNRFFEGANCETEQFVSSPAGDGCSYFIDDLAQIGSGNYNAAKTRCEDLKASLAMIKNPQQQEAVFGLTQTVYGAIENLYLWIGAELHQHIWLWNDGTNVSLVVASGYPFWGEFQPIVNQALTNLLLTNSPEHSYLTVENKRLVVWASSYPYFESGYVCEKKVNPSTACDGSPCVNGGVCVIIGCSFRCNCTDGWVGQRCQYMLPHLISFTPETIPFRSSFTLECVVEAVLRAEIHWKIYKHSTFGSGERFVRITPQVGSPFSVDTRYEGNTTVSRLTVSYVGLCINDTEIACYASNNVQRTMQLHSFETVREFYMPLNDLYYTFSNNETYTRSEAEQECEMMNGSLASIPDEDTQNALLEAINEEVLGTYWTVADAWIGLRKSEDGSFNSAQTYFNWAEGEPQISYSCAYISTDGKWKTQSCSSQNNSFPAHYICEIADRGIPRIEELRSPFGSKTTSSIIATIRPHSNMTSYMHRLRATELDANEQLSSHSVFIDVIPQSVMTNSDRFEATIPSLAPERQHEVKVYVLPDLCSVPVINRHLTNTSASAQALVSLQENVCHLQWVWPTQDAPKLQHFTINVTKLPFSYSTGIESNLLQAFSSENILQNMDSDARAFRFTARPNRRHVIEVTAFKESGKQLRFKPIGECSIPPEAPSAVKPVMFSNHIFSGPSFSFELVDESNGPVSCYFILVTFRSDEEESSSDVVVSRAFMERASELSYRPLPEQPYIALAIPNTPGLSSFTSYQLGDNATSACDVFDLNNAEINKFRKRNVETVLAYKGQNRPLESNLYYSFLLVSSTPIDTDSVAFSSSTKTTHYVNLNKSYSVYASIASVSLIVIVVMVSISLDCVVRFMVRHRSTKDTLEIIDVPNEEFENLRKLEGLITLRERDMQRQGVIRKRKSYTLWKVVLSTQLRYGIESLAKVVLEGSKLTPRQRQDFANEVEILNRVGQHESVVAFYGVSFNLADFNEGSMILTELCPRGTLSEYLKNAYELTKEKPNRPAIRPKQMTHFCFQIARGFQFLHGQGVIHRALSSKKVFISYQTKCKIGDFQYARTLRHAASKYVTPDMAPNRNDFRWMAPEAYCGQIFSCSSDVWSLAVVMWEIYSFGFLPYSEVTNWRLERAIVQNNQRLKQPPNCPPVIYEIMHACWHTIPLFRPTARMMREKLQEILTDTTVSDPPFKLYEDQQYENEYEMVGDPSILFESLQAASEAKTKESQIYLSPQVTLKETMQKLFGVMKPDEVKLEMTEEDEDDEEDS